MRWLALAVLPCLLVGCDEAETQPFRCMLRGEDAPASLDRLGCQEDFDALASAPLDASIPGARSVKFIVDRSDENRLYFQDSQRYPVHWEFAREHLSGAGRPLVPDLTQFNEEQYYSPTRRFVLGALTFYEEPGVWALEIAPYDTASAEMITLAFDLVAADAFFGAELKFHPTSLAIQQVAEQLPARVSRITTDELFDGIDYQPLNLQRAVGKLRVMAAADLEYDPVSFRDIVVLDRVPNDISVVAGIVTAELQTPLSHINVLSQNRGTPNMALRGADTRAEFLDLEGEWVELTVGAFEYSLRKVSRDHADEWWEGRRPEPLGVPRLDRERRGLVELAGVLDDDLPLRDAIGAQVPALGGKAAHYAALEGIEGVRSPKAFAVPVAHYLDFMAQHALDEHLAQLLADPEFSSDVEVRMAALEDLRNRIRRAPLDEAWLTTLMGELGQYFEPDLRIRFRSSTNAEDLEGFTGAGLYTSKSAYLEDPVSVADAIRNVWASVWRFRAFEERSYYGIEQTAVGMALLVHRAFPDEFANGVALTANPFDSSGLEPGFYVNVQKGEASVVLPDPGVTSDQFVYQYERAGQPILFYEHSSLVPEGSTVLTTEQTYELGGALDAIHRHFRPAYGPPDNDPTAWYAMDVELKLDVPIEGGEPVIFIKQARPHPGRSGGGP